MDADERIRCVIIESADLFPGDDRIAGGGMDLGNPIDFFHTGKNALTLILQTDRPPSPCPR